MLGGENKRGLTSLTRRLSQGGGKKGGHVNPVHGLDVSCKYLPFQKDRSQDA